MHTCILDILNLWACIVLLKNSVYSVIFLQNIISSFDGRVVRHTLFRTHGSITQMCIGLGQLMTSVDFRVEWSNLMVYEHK